jgi:site-specific DNA recombinase
MEGIVASFAQFDNDVRSERTVQGMKARLEKGGWTFPPPLGYIASRDGAGRKTFTPDPERAQLITHAFEIFASGLYNKNQVLAIVTKMGLRTKTGKPLSAQSFGQLLRKPIYAGRVIVRGWNVSSAANFPPLVSTDTFDRVQALLAEGRLSISPRLRSNPEFPLRHFVRCGKCERPLTASWSRGRNQRYAYYRCQNRTCRNVNIRREELERTFVAFLEHLKPKPEYLRLFGEIIVDVWEQKQSLAAAVHDTLLHHLAELKRNKDLLVRAFVYERALDQQTYQEQLDKLNEDITLAELEERDAQLDELDIAAAVNFTQYVLLNGARLWTESGPDQKQRLQKLIFPEGVLFADGVYRTTATSMIFLELEKIQAEKEGLVALPRIEPGFED